MLKLIRFIFIILCTTFVFGCSKTNEPANSSTDAKEEAKLVVKPEIPFDFKGVVLGQTIGEVQAKFKGMLKTGESGDLSLMCSDDYNSPRPCSKVSNLTIVKQPLKTAFFVFNSENKLRSIILQFSENYYEEVKETLIKKYGEPTSIEKTPLSNKLTGAESVYEHLVWTYDNIVFLDIANREIDGSSYKDLGIMHILSTDGSSSLKEEPADI